MTNELNPFILKNIYSDSDLYLLTIDKQEEPIPFLGKNQKKCVILVNEKNHTFLEKTDLTFLENILLIIMILNLLIRFE